MSSRVRLTARLSPIARVEHGSRRVRLSDLEEVLFTARIGKPNMPLILRPGRNRIAQLGGDARCADKKEEQRGGETSHGA